MKKARLEAFSDGVIAIIITIMVLEMKVPHGADLSDLRSLIPVFTIYILSFTFVAIYWNNHHHLLHAVESINGKVLWANMHLLFWLSLIPFVTSWMGENHFSEWPVVLYGVVLFFAGIAYYILSQVLIMHHGKQSKLAAAIGNDFKGIISVALYFVAVAMAFVDTRISLILYACVALIWLIPDRRIEQKV